MLGKRIGGCGEGRASESKDGSPPKSLQISHCKQQLNSENVSDRWIDGSMDQNQNLIGLNSFAYLSELKAATFFACVYG